MGRFSSLFVSVIRTNKSQSFKRDAHRKFQNKNNFLILQHVAAVFPMVIAANTASGRGVTVHCTKRGLSRNCTVFEDRW